MPENLTSSIGPEQQFKNYLDEGKFMIQKSKSLDKFFFIKELDNFISFLI